MRILSLLFLLASLAAFPAPVPAGERALPGFEAVTRIVERQFASKPRFERSDIISRGDVEPIIDTLIDLGWRPGDVEELYDAFLPDNHSLVIALRTDAGTQFSRQVGRLPGMYDRLERLLWLSDGSRLLKQLVTDPQGPEIAQRWTTAEGIADMQTRIAADPRGANFAMPTGHIHTVDEFLASLKKAHDGALKSRAARTN
jgi:hypothetical protein